MTDVTQQIEKYKSQLDQEETELKDSRKMLKDIIDNDEELLSLKAEMDDFKARYKARKEDLINQHKEIYNAIEELKGKKKALESALCGGLLGYYKQTNKLQVKLGNGKLYNMNFKSKMKETDQPNLFDQLPDDVTVERML